MNQQTISLDSAFSRPIVQAMWVALAAFLLVLASQLALPAFARSLVWPANAVLVGLLLRRGGPLRILSWGLLGAGLFLAHLSLGVALSWAVIDSLADLAGIRLAWWILARFWPLDNLRAPRAVVRMLLAGLAASAVTVVFGRFAHAEADFAAVPLETIISGVLGQWLGYGIFLLPVLLLPGGTLPGLDRRLRDRISLRHLGDWSAWIPGLLLAISLLSCFLLGGPGALLLPFAALLYGAYACQQRTAAWLGLLSALCILFGFDAGWARVPDNLLLLSAWGRVSLQMGILLLVAVPLLVSSALAARSDLITSLNRALDHDDLTQALSRPAFMRGAQEYLQRIPPAPYGNGLMMLDIDHFKQLNDRHGHAAGDNVLCEFTRIIREAIRPEDLFGRLGGEEFGLVLPNCSLVETAEVAERLRVCVGQIQLYHDSDEPLRITVSIGVVHHRQGQSADLDQLLLQADQALYRAKRQGRNRYCVHGAEAASTSGDPSQLRQSA
ncbi:MAG: diguanylate cyclase [Castellaniella sp.]|uniref:GGDEF domain-containing protein n=1 Tax=Castellaniella sp. TaxID=1955812 RepID=UPI002A35E445|nr:diguanylate cyclase [Castellaniella sp.]MDY0309037.1 diguanylate cyclase [Castellaniella sp.]